MRNYEKPFIEDESIELEDIIASSLGVEDETPDYDDDPNKEEF